MSDVLEESKIGTFLKLTKISKNAESQKRGKKKKVPRLHSIYTSSGLVNASKKEFEDRKVRVRRTQGGDLRQSRAVHRHSPREQNWSLANQLVDRPVGVVDRPLFLVYNQPKKEYHETREKKMKKPKEQEALKNLEEFDLEGTEIMYLPKEIGKLISLRCFKASFCQHANLCKETKQIDTIIPTGVFSKLNRLRKLSIDMNLDDEWWDADVRVILNELSHLKSLDSLQLYLPFIVGHHRQRFISRLPHEVEEIFKKQNKRKKCPEYINNEDYCNIKSLGNFLTSSIDIALELIDCTSYDPYFQGGFLAPLLENPDSCLRPRVCHHQSCLSSGTWTSNETPMDLSSNVKVLN
ncbi:hypothetical protein HYC85_009915 [Camellia sinensis]|uniref:Uncharacterized protein n=1 Tax=Camellia sinensis TaxID=4442 RepID=A0A7J7HIA7_CAMSI|nr:hypothetical protein HYC85_009915 [Camellia sinensis]